MLLTDLLTSHRAAACLSVSRIYSAGLDCEHLQRPTSFPVTIQSRRSSHRIKSTSAKVLIKHYKSSHISLTVKPFTNVNPRPWEPWPIRRLVIRTCVMRHGRTARGPKTTTGFFCLRAVKGHPGVGNQSCGQVDGLSFLLWTANSSRTVARIHK